MQDAIKTALSNLIRDASALEPAAKVGIYVHGSQARGDAHDGSDLDLLILRSPALTPEQYDELHANLLGAATGQGVALDLKLIPADIFAADPWVDLNASLWIGGYPWHKTLAVRTHDQAARESMLVLAVLISDRAFTSTRPSDLRKSFGRITSVLAALLGDPVPTSSREAITLLKLHEHNPIAREVLNLAGALNTTEGAVSPDLTARILAALDAVVNFLAEQNGRGTLGSACSAAALQVLGARDSTESGV